MPFYAGPLEKRIILIIIIAIVLMLLIPIIIASATLPDTGNKRPSDIDFKINPGKTINVYLHDEKKVVTLDLEEYILRVVAAEMPAGYEPEALKAQACAARTYSVNRLQNGGCSRSEGAGVCTSSAHCQAYISPEKMKKNWGGKYEEKYNKIKKAVEDTRGMIIVYKGKPISALYHSTSGGYTENSEDVFASAKPYLRAVKSEGEEPYAPRFHGQVKVSYSKFADKIKSYSKGAEITEDNIKTCISDIKRSGTGRVETIKIGGKMFTGRDIRKIFGLNSTNFKISCEGGRVVFDTIGFGHGVGLSQTGANAMAKNGAGYAEILKHYYTGVDIVSIY